MLGQGLVFSTLVVTKMAGPEELMAQEGIFLAHLESADSIESSNSGILLLSGGLVVLTLVPSGTANASTAS
jgi:heat shock protein HslJ